MASALIDLFLGVARKRWCFVHSVLVLSKKVKRVVAGNAKLWCTSLRRVISWHFLAKVKNEAAYVISGFGSC